MDSDQSLNDVIARLKANPTHGWTTDEASQRREADGVFNVVDPPIKCPSWVCCLLPCIHSLPSRKAFALVKPEDAEVKRNGKWVRYDSSSLVLGDVIRLQEGDVVPADCVVLSVDNDGSSSSSPDGGGELLVDVRAIVGGDDKLRSAKPGEEDGVITLYMGGHVVQGGTTALVTAIGPNTLLARQIRDGNFPPPAVVSTLTTTRIPMGNAADNSNAEEDDAAGISLISQKDSIA